MVEFSEEDTPVFEEVMEVLKRHPDFEYLRLKDEAMLLDFATVYARDDIRFTFKAGNEVKVDG